MYRINVIGCCKIFYFSLDKMGVVPGSFVKGPDRWGPQIITSSVKDHIKGEVRDPYEWKSEARVPFRREHLSGDPFEQKLNPEPQERKKRRKESRRREVCRICALKQALQFAKFFRTRFGGWLFVYPWKVEGRNTREKLRSNPMSWTNIIPIQ
jgi:hypothetical protein